MENCESELPLRWIGEFMTHDARFADYYTGSASIGVHYQAAIVLLH